MAVAANTQQPDGADRLATIQPQLLGVSAQSNLQLAMSSTQKARRILRYKTNKLIEKRKEVDAALQKEAARDESTLRASDYLIRQHLIKLDDALARCESRHLRARAKAVEERKRYYQWDPSTERAIDHALFKWYHTKFKHHLGSSLAEREQFPRTGALDDDASSDANHGGDDAEGRANMPLDVSSEASSQPSTDGSASDSERDSDSDSSDSDSSDSDSSDSDERDAQDDNKYPSFGLDGSFDDHVRALEKSKKRKLVDGSGGMKAEQKKARKEQAATKKDNASSGSQSLPFSVSRLVPNNEDDVAGDQAAIDSMSQPSSFPDIMIHGESTFHGFTTTNTDSATICNDTAVDATHDRPLLPNTSDLVLPGNATPTESPTESKPPSLRAAAPAVVPWYTLHAQRQLQIGFDDMVREVPFNQRSRRVHRQHFMSGALPDTDPIACGHLPSPPASSLSPDPSSDAAPATGKKSKTPKSLHKSKDDRMYRTSRNKRGPLQRQKPYVNIVETRRNAARSAQASKNRT